MLEVKRTMNDSYDNTITICNTFGLEIDCIESCTSIVRNKQVIIDLKLTDKRLPCPDCGNESVKIKGYVAKKINHSILMIRDVFLYTMPDAIFVQSAIQPIMKSIHSYSKG